VPWSTILQDFGFGFGVSGEAYVFDGFPQGEFIGGELNREWTRIDANEKPGRA
jgi:hypothetical protein